MVLVCEFACLFGGDVEFFNKNKNESFLETSFFEQTSNDKISGFWQWLVWFATVTGELARFKARGCRAVLGAHQRLEVHSCKDLLWTAYGGDKARREQSSRAGWAKLRAQGWGWGATGTQSSTRAQYEPWMGGVNHSRKLLNPAVANSENFGAAWFLFGVGGQLPRAKGPNTPVILRGARSWLSSAYPLLFQSGNLGMKAKEGR